MKPSAGGPLDRKHIRGSSLLLAGRLLALLINFLVQILIVRYLTKEGYGAFAYGYGLATFAKRLVPLGTDKAVGRFIPMYHERSEWALIKGGLLVVTATTLAVGALLCGTIFALNDVLEGNVVRDPLSLSVLMVMIALAPLDAIEGILEKLLATFGHVRSIFFRRYLITPLLRLSAVVSLMIVGGNAVFLASAYVAATAIGIVISLVILKRSLKDDDLLGRLRKIRAEYPTRRMFQFGVPLLSSDIVFGLRNSLVVFLLELFHGVAGVAGFRAIIPVARLNYLVFDSFQVLYEPTASRMYARKDEQGISQLYWRSTAWISLLTLPVFLATFSLAETTTSLLFGPSYQSSAPILAIMSLGMYLNAAFGFNALTLQVYGRVRTIVWIDGCSAVAALGLNCLVVPFYGPMGGALVSSLVLIAQNIGYQVALSLAGQVGKVPREVALIHLCIFGMAIGLLTLQQWVSMPVIIAFAFASVMTLIAWVAFLKLLRIHELFPEIQKLLPKSGWLRNWLIGPALANSPTSDSSLSTKQSSP